MKQWACLSKTSCTTYKSCFICFEHGLIRITTTLLETLQPLGNVGKCWEMLFCFPGSKKSEGSIQISKCVQHVFKMLGNVILFPGPSKKLKRWEMFPTCFNISQHLGPTGWGVTWRASNGCVGPTLGHPAPVWGSAPSTASVSVGPPVLLLLPEFPLRGSSRCLCRCHRLSFDVTFLPLAVTFFALAVAFLPLPAGAWRLHWLLH